MDDDRSRLSKRFIGAHGGIDLSQDPRYRFQPPRRAPPREERSAIECHGDCAQRLAAIAYVVDSFIMACS